MGCPTERLPQTLALSHGSLGFPLLWGNGINRSSAEPRGETQWVHLSFSQKRSPACLPSGWPAKSSLVGHKWEEAIGELMKTGKGFLGIAFPDALGYLCPTLH